MALPRVSLIMPAYNAAQFINTSIRSVLDQTWQEWELLVINDGSQDRTADIVRSFNDSRIRLFEQSNAGVSKARNSGLENAQGEFVAFLDADDVLPPDSLKARAEILMEEPDTAFVDGRVLTMHHLTGLLTERFRPSHSGDAFPLLMNLSARVFFGPTWMIRRSVIGNTRFPENMTHAEDLAFYLTIARRGRYSYTDHVVLHYRHGHSSAMSDLDGLHRGYRALLEHTRQLTPSPTSSQLNDMNGSIRRVMAKCYLKALRPLDALRTILFD